MSDSTDVPAGFRTVETFADAAMGLVCDECACVVARADADKHLKWHRKQDMSSLLGPGPAAFLGGL